MAGEIEVRIGGSGVVSGDEAKPDAATEARCSLCGAKAEAVASVAADTFACADCLRARLEAMSVARWRLRDPSPGLPWGKVSG